MLTLFSLRKKSKSEIENRAIENWKKLGCEILLFEENQLKRNEFGTPLVNDLIKKAQELARGNIVSYISSDIILVPDFVWWANTMSCTFQNFLMVGARYDIQPDGKIKFRGKAGMDYWIFPKGMIKDFPPFAIGRRSFDNYLLAWAIQQKIPTIDATLCVKIYHQWHKEHNYNSPENKIQVERNYKLAQGQLATLRDTEYILTPNGLVKRKWSLYNLIKPLLPIWRKIKRL